MTNSEIIIREAVAGGICTEQEVKEILASGHMIPLHTFQAWRDMGYSVRKGEHARVTTKLWKYKGKKPDTETEVGADGEEAGNGHYYLAKAFLFTAEQVERTEAGKKKGESSK